MNKSERLEQLVEYFGNGNKSQFAKILGVKAQTINTWISRDTYDTELIFAKCNGINASWLLNGEGNMLQSEYKPNLKEQNDKKNIIPFYDDVVSIGGITAMTASMDQNMPSHEFIDAGDWFVGATAAIRHYGDSMIEYPSGCILALKELHDQRQIVWGRNYCVETDEMRVTKRLQAGNKDYIMAYSTNTDQYPDGRQIHEPFPIYKNTIRRIFMVIGCVIKEYSSGPVMIKP